MDPRNELFKKVINLVDDEDLELISLKSFTKEKSEEILKKLNNSECEKNDIMNMLVSHEEYFVDILEIEEEDKEDNKPFDVIDITNIRYGLSDISNNSNNVIKCIAYLNDLVDRFINGEASTMSAVVLLKDGRSSIWVPNGFDHDKVDKLFDPLIMELKTSDNITQLN